MSQSEGHAGGSAVRFVMSGGGFGGDGGRRDGMIYNMRGTELNWCYFSCLIFLK